MATKPVKSVKLPRRVYPAHTLSRMFPAFIKHFPKCGPSPRNVLARHHQPCY